MGEWPMNGTSETGKCGCAALASRVPPTALCRGVQQQHAMSGKGKGKAKEAPAGTKSISSFFAKKPPAAAPPQADAPDAPSPAKRARVQHASDVSDAVTPPPPPPLSAEPPDAAAPPASAATGDDDEMPDAPLPLRPQRPAAPPAAPLAFPASDPERHAHFSERLSLGPPRRNGAARDALVGAPMSAYGRDAGPGGPYTPLERQIVALKRAHPGILLMVEARARRDACRALAGKPCALHLLGAGALSRAVCLARHTGGLQVPLLRCVGSLALSRAQRRRRCEQAADTTRPRR
jgi:hypothetical protein